MEVGVREGLNDNRRARRRHARLIDTQGSARVLIGLIHVGALPGTRAASDPIDAISARAVGEARACRNAGFAAVMIPDLLVLGNLVVDDIVLPDGTTRMGQPGGAVVYAALGASLWGMRVGLVSRVGDDYPSDTLDALRTRGIDLSGVRPLGRSGVRSWVLYERLGRRLVHHLGSPTSAEATPSVDDVPDEWRRAPAALATPAPLAVQHRLISGLRASGVTRLAVDPHTPITDETIDAWKGTLAEVQHFFVSDSELQLRGVRPATPDLPARLGDGQLRTIALKRGEAGGILFDLVSGRSVTWSPHAGDVVDPTGAGDAFAGGFLSAIIAGGTTDLALARGVVSASFAIEAWGPAGLLDATLAGASRRLLRLR